MSWLTSRHRRFVGSAVLAGAALLGLAACETTGDLTVDLPDTKATSSSYLEIPVTAATVRINPALTPTLKTDHYLVGRLRDQVTGLTEAQAVLNLRPSTLLDSLPGRLRHAELESVTLLAPFEQVYGSANVPLRFEVYPLAQRLDERVVYTQASKPGAGAPALATNLSAPLNATRLVSQTATDQSGTVITTPQPDQVVSQRLPKAAFGGAFQVLNDTVAFSQTALDQALPGLVLAPSAGHEGSLVAFGRGRVAAQLQFAFSYDSVQTSPLPAVRRLRRYSLFFGPGRNSLSGPAAAEDPRYYTYLVNDPAGSQLAALSTPADALPAAALDGRSYLQAGIGLGTRITFSSSPQLDTLRNTPGIAINRAELRVPVQPYTTGVFPNPASFYALEVDAQNQVLQRIVDQVPTERVVQRDGANPQRNDFEAAATLVNSSNSAPYYALSITSYLQAYLAPNGLGVSTPDNPLPLPAALILTPTLRSVTVGTTTGTAKTLPSLTLDRAVLDATTIKLRVYYSRLR